jgi:hypothetical protein
VVPALEILGAAGLEAKTDDVQSYVDRIVELAKSPALYAESSKACNDIKEQCFERWDLPHLCRKHFMRCVDFLIPRIA